MVRQQYRRVAVFTFVIAAALAGAGCGPKNAPVQDGARPFGLTTLSSVKAAGSDWRAWWFDHFTLARLVALANKEYSHSAVVDHFEQLKLDPAKLNLEEACPVRIYYIGEGSGYRNALGVNLAGIGIESGEPKILFPNVNSTIQLDASAASIRKGRLPLSKRGERTPEAPMLPGDFVDLGKLPGGTILNFFLTPDAHYVYTAYRSQNPDNMDHMVAMAVQDTPFLLVSFEDMFGTGDADYEDCVFAVQLSTFNVQALIGQIDPWRRIKQGILLGTIIAVVFGGPPSVLLIRRKIRIARREAAFTQARERIARDDVRGAIKLAAQLKNSQRSRTGKKLCAAFLADLCETAKDNGMLASLFDETPEIFLEREAASLKTARVQLASGRLDAFGALRSLWQGKEASADAWRLFDADAFIEQGKPHDAALLLEKPAAGALEARRLVRLGLLHAETCPAEALPLFEQARALAPNSADVRLHAGRVLERLGRTREAVESYRAAIAASPHDPIARDALAECLRRGGDLRKALDVWEKALPPPSLDFIWCKALFWDRVATPLHTEIAALERPVGRFRPFVDYLLALPKDRFMDALAFHALERLHPHLRERQEVYWLRVLDALREGRDVEAQWLLNCQGFERESWNAALEIALKQVLSHRRSGAFDIAAAHAGGETVAFAGHPFLSRLEGSWRGRAGFDEEQLPAILSSQYLFPALLAATGWRRAAGMFSVALPVEEKEFAWLGAILASEE